MMIRSFLALLFWLMLLGGPALEAAGQGSGPKLTGTWQGVLQLPAANLEVIFSISEMPAGSRTATLQVPQQAAQTISAEVIVRADSVVLRVPAINSAFAGRLLPNGQQLQGEWRQGGHRLPLTLHYRNKSTPAVGAAPTRPQLPRPPLPYQVQEVKVPNPAAGGLLLAGTLTVPSGKGPFPAVVLITGSGPEDRDETMFGHKPFAVLADYLTCRGVAVLRLDDRGVGQSEGYFRKATTADFATDTRAALTFVRSQPSIDARQVGLLGHSEGSLIAAMVAAQSAPPAFVVSLAGPGLPGAAMLLRQKADLSQAAGLDSTRIALGQRVSQQLFAALRATPDSAQAVARMAAILPQENPGLTAAQAQTIAASLVTPWLRLFLDTDPRLYWQRVRCPVLLLNGSRDLQVAAAINLSAIEQALHAGGNRSVTVRELAGLNHLFQTSQTGLPTEYEQISETISPEALRIIVDWIWRK